jgi:hypothetical protein
MKTSTRMSLAALTVAVAFCFAACPFNKHIGKDVDAQWKFNLNIHGTSASETYLPVNKGKFDEALCDLDKQDPNDPGKKRGEYHIVFKASATASPTPEYKPECRGVAGNIKTEKVTKSAMADGASADASAANDPNATQHVRADSAQDLKAVLDAFTQP